MDLTPSWDSVVKSLSALQDASGQLLKHIQLTSNNGKITTSDKDSSGKEEDLNQAGVRKVVVYVSVVFIKLGDIDTIQERFSADAIVQARWREPLLDGQCHGVEVELKNSSSHWNPKLFVENSISELKESISYTVSYASSGEATIWQKRRIRGLFFEKMELQHYPFDSQDLTITMSTEKSDREVQLVGDPSEISTVNSQSFVDEQEWKLHRHVNTWTSSLPNEYKNMTHPAISVGCLASRRFNFFVWNIVLVMIFICGLIFTTFSVTPVKVENRLQMSFILVLSIINFKYIVSNTLPKVPYLTYLDKYVLVSLGVLFLTCIWHAIAAHLTPGDVQLMADYIALAILLGMYIIFNIVFFSVIILMIRHRRKIYIAKEYEQEEKEKAIEESHMNGTTEIQLDHYGTTNVAFSK